MREHRKRERMKKGTADSTFVEIYHTFGPIRKSVYKVNEFDSGGLSFSMPLSDGFFIPQTPLRYSIVAANHEKVTRYGVVRYYYRTTSETGNSFYVIGVENVEEGKSAASNKYPIRPQRYRLSDVQTEHALHFSIGERDYSYVLIDISRFSAAFYCPEEDSFNFRSGAVLSGVCITYGRSVVFRGTSVVVRSVFESGKYRVVIEPRNCLFNVDAIEIQETVSAVSSEIRQVFAVCDSNLHIHNDFKAVVSDMYVYLSSIKRYLESPAVARLEENNEGAALLENMADDFYCKLDTYASAFDPVAERVAAAAEQHGLYKSYFQKVLHPLILASPFCYRSFTKPRGYPGDYEIMRMIKEDGFNGKTLFAKLFNHAMLRSPMACANRNRIEALADMIEGVCLQYDRERIPVLSLACGPAFEIQRLMEKNPALAGRIDLTLLDQDEEALRFSQNALYKQRILFNCNMQIRFLHEGIVPFLKKNSRLNAQKSAYRIIYMFGIFDYFDDRVCRFFIERCLAMLESGGALFISNYSRDGHQHRVFAEYAFEWYMTYRNEKDLKVLAENLGCKSSAVVSEESTKVVKFLCITKQ